MRCVFDSGTSVIISLEARFNEGQFDPVGRSAQPLEDMVAQTDQMGLRVFIETPDAIPAVDSLLARFKDDGSVRGRGPVSLQPLGLEIDTGAGLERCDVEIALGDDLPVSPKIKSALKSLPGVSMVEEV